MGGIDSWMKCSTKACCWPATSEDGLCPHCWNLRHGDFPDVRKPGPLATAQADAPSLRGISYARRWDTGGKAAQRAWNGPL
jgi:hypothetical protein